ncbi:MAG: sigma-54 dependent transcriptional regulator [Nanoarchaeota archaeon]
MSIYLAVDQETYVPPPVCILQVSLGSEMVITPPHPLEGDVVYLAPSFNGTSRQAIEFLKKTGFRTIHQLNDSSLAGPSTLNDLVGVIPNSMVGESPAIRQVHADIQTFANLNSPVLITGESGVGKELVARALHNQSSKKEKPYVTVNCPAIPVELFESELFGHTKGAYTGADGGTGGYIGEAQDGTLFFDEIGEFPLIHQAKLLRLLEQHEYRPVGGSKNYTTPARFIAATNQDLVHLVQKGKFRQDLYYRLNALPLPVPLLFERKEDISRIATYYALTIQKGKPLLLDPSAATTLQAYPWPGNVRELRNQLELAVARAQTPYLSEKDFTLPPSEERPILGKGKGSLRQRMREYEKRLILDALEQNHWNISETARQLSLERSNLHRKINGLSIQTQE